MLVTKMKSEVFLGSLMTGKVFIVVCRGCSEVGAPEKETDELLKSVEADGNLAGKLITDYICNTENIRLQLESKKEELDAADSVLVVSCGIGVQTVAEILDDKRVYAACDTVAVPGGQGVTPLEYDCMQCGNCFLNLTGGICPLTACSKSLLNGQCGGARDGMCEVDPEMECGWERIIRRLKMVGRMDALDSPVQIRDYGNEITAARIKNNT